MADLHQLENKMRILKLSGMVETLDMRLNQTQKKGWLLVNFWKCCWKMKLSTGPIRDWLPG